MEKDQNKLIIFISFALIPIVSTDTALDNNCGCSCQAIQIVSEEIASKNISEYSLPKYNASDSEVINHNSLGPEYWEKKWIPVWQEKRAGEKYSDLTDGYKVLDVSFPPLIWKTYKNMSRSTNLNYKDLLGTYNLFSCPEVNVFGIKTRYPVYQKILSDGTEAYLSKNKYGNKWQVGPRPEATNKKILRFEDTSQFQEVEKSTVAKPSWIKCGGDLWCRNKNETSSTPVFKSEIWFEGSCESLCPGNCTEGRVFKQCDSGGGGGFGRCKKDAQKAEWNFVQKSLHPAADDQTILDLSLRTVCKKDYDESLKNKVPICTTDDSGRVKHKACVFPFKFKGTLHSECITEGSKDGLPWCPTEVNKRKTPLKDKRGSCDKNTCQSLNFESTTSLFKGTCPKGFIEHKRRCYGFFVHHYARTTWIDAQKKCRSFNGGDLVSILTKGENDFVTQKVLEINPSLKDNEHYHPWIGLKLRKRRNKNPEAGTYDCPRCAWSDRQIYTEHLMNQWADSEPSTLQGKGGKYDTLDPHDRPENCVHIYPNGEWNNANCDEPRGYICAGPIPDEEDFCDPNPCQNEGTCDNNIDGTGYECVCNGPYKGKECEESIYEEDEYTQYTDYEEIGYQNFTTHETPTQCVDSDDCEELGIVDEDSCEFAEWANERCPVTCGTCTTKETAKQCVDSKDCEELGVIDLDSCEFAPWANDRCPLTCGQCATNETPKQCVDSKDCEELGIVDLDSCDFAPWANDRCPVTCDTCTKREDDYAQYTDYESITTNSDYESITPKQCVDSEDCEELGIVDLDSCEFAPWANDRCPATCGQCNDECKDQPDCEELGIIDADSCEFAGWAYDRCPVTCNAC